MAGKKRGLGKGLEALIPDEPVPNPESAKKNEDGETAGQELMVRISRVVPNADQPRKVFEEMRWRNLRSRSRSMVSFSR